MLEALSPPISTVQSSTRSWVGGVSHIYVSLPTRTLVVFFVSSIQS